MTSTGVSILGGRVLVVEDEALIAEEICGRLSQHGYAVVGVVDTGEGAIEAALAHRPDVILMDIRLKGSMDGIDAAVRINERLPVPIVYLTAQSDRNTLQRAKAAAIFGYILKPLHIKTLLVAIEVAMDRFETDRRLEENRLTYAAILWSISDAVMATDTEGSVQFLNPAAERLTGWPSSAAKGRSIETVLDLAARSDCERTRDLIASAVRTRGLVRLSPDAEAVGRDGGRVAVAGTISCVMDCLGRLVGTSITLRDVTEARRAQSALQTMAGRLQAVVDTAADGVLLLDANGTALMSNPACAALFGCAVEEIVGRGIDDWMSSPLEAEGFASTGPVRLSGRATAVRRKDQSEIAAEVSIGETCDAGATVFVCVIHDVSERNALEAALFNAVESERRRFSADLHDGLGQELTGLSLLLAALARSARNSHAGLAGDLEHAHAVAKFALHSCKAIARGLSPVADSEGGLVGALRALVARLDAPSGPQVNLSIRLGSRLFLSAAATDHLYRIAQEAVANALKHARATSIRVTLDVEPASVRLEICDDGAGLGLNGTDPGGLGLRTMHYRAAMIGARIYFAPRRLSGVSVVCECPQFTEGLIERVS
jgi:PAS domain S-box-containing protein